MSDLNDVILENEKASPIISIAIIAMNNREDLERLFTSLQAPLKSIPHELIFFDNASTDGTVEMIRKDFPYVTLFENKENQGVARARNQALKKCTGKYIYIVDSDCEYREGDFQDAINYLESNQNVGLLGFRLYYPNGDLQDTGRTLPGIRDLIVNRMDTSERIKNSKRFKRHRMRDFDHMKPREAGFVSGASQFFRKSLLDDIGYLDETMFYGYEDSDFCARVIKHGLKVVYFPWIVATHYHQRLTKKKPLSRMTYHQINSYRIFRRKHGSDLKRINRNLISDNDPPEYNA